MEGWKDGSKKAGKEREIREDGWEETLVMRQNADKGRGLREGRDEMSMGEAA